MRTCLLLSLCLLAASTPAGRAASARPLPALRDTNGALRRPLNVGTNRAVALIFIGKDCPISNGYAPEINRICAAYATKRVAFYLVNEDTGVSTAAIKQHARQYGFRCPVLLDPTHALARRVGATVTPEAAVYAPNGTRLYRGRIDDKVLDFGKVRFQARTHDLRDALDATLTGKPIPQPVTKAIGCFI